MIVKCPHCDTADGMECVNNMRGPRTKPRFRRICSLDVHVAAVGECDVCRVHAPTVLKKYVVEWMTAEVPHWETIATGRMVRRYTDEDIERMRPPERPTHWGPEADARREAQRQKDRENFRLMLVPHQIHACPECVAALRVAQQVAFDACLSQREGLNAAKTEAA